MLGLREICLSATVAVLLSAPAAAEKPEALTFFEGRTESSGTIKILMRKPFKSHSLGRGRIESDGTLVLVQQVQEEGRPPRERRWRIRQVSPQRFLGTMSEASGPVTVDEIGGRYRFRFKMKGNLSIEQWLAPLPDGKSARSSTTIRKLGMKVGSSIGTIRKLAGS